ncbi:MAG: DNA mismatch repair protein MutS [Candidatus Latescibacteria bacterium]|nr:DNA mismatch repair protein MutS [Candidatus Latescibacterota bacterium]
MAEHGEEKLTPAMAQYHHFKRQHRDAILLFRMGDFYETFYEDAREMSRLLGLTLTARNHGKTAGEVPLAGVPHHAVEAYVARLLRLGRKVAICEQVEDPRKAKGVVKRDVVQVVSPGTALADSMLEQQRHNFLVCLCTDQDRAGLASVDLSTGDFLLDEVPLDQLADELERLAPAELLLSEAADPQWVETLRQVLPRAAHSRLEAWQFEYRQAYETLTEQLRVHSLKGFDCEDLHQGICAGGAALHYLRDNQRGAVEHLNRITRQRREHCLYLDATTRRNLELLGNQQDGGEQGALIEVLDHTRTPMGARLLRQWVAAPLRDPAAINQRLDAVEVLVGERGARARLQETLSQVGDLERMMARICCLRANARDLVGLGRSLGQVPSLRQQAGALTPALLQELANIGLPVVDELVELIGRTLVEDPPAILTEGGMVRSGCDAELDELRQASAGGKEWIARLQVQERERTGIGSLKVGFNQVFGYYLEVSKANLDRVPADYIRKQTLVNAERFLTPELKEWEAKVLGAEEKINEIETRIFLELRAQVAGWTTQVQQIARSLAQLDVLVSLSEVAQRDRYVRPLVDEGPGIEIEGGRHPVIERRLQEGRFVPNDLFLDAESRVVLITGPNMAGKSTIIRQVGLIALLAQLGSFVPARRARLGVVDRIFTRVGAADNLARGESTFRVEMNEAANILNNATERSLILMDELGRGTSTFDGLSLAWAIVEFLHDCPARPRTLFATHYHELTKLEGPLVRLKNANVLVREEGGHVVFLHRLAAGPCDRSYGINVAQMAGMPTAVVGRAKEILARLERGEPQTPAPRRPAAEEQLPLFAVAAPEPPLVAELRQLDLNQLTPLQALLKLGEWQEQLQKGD